MKKSLKFCFLLLSIISIDSFAQQEAMFTHYMFNTQAVNPAYAGSREALTVTGLHRSQWVGFDGAPVTQTLTMHTPILNKNMGIGLSVINDQIGPSQFTSFFADVVYRTEVSKTGKLAFGIKGGINALNVGLNSLDLAESNDKAFENNVSSEILPNFGFGIYYQAEKFYTGLSVPRILESDYISSNIGSALNFKSERKHYYFIAGGLIDLNENIALKPSTFVKATSGAPIEVDLTTCLVFNNAYWAGVMLRTGDAFGLLAGLNITDQLQVGYSFDWSYGLTTGTYNSGSHEIMLRYDFIFAPEKKIISPRYF